MVGSALPSPIHGMDDRRFAPERYEAMARELRHIAKRLIDAENIVSITR
jgi:hypothetical protein